MLENFFHKKKIFFIPISSICSEIWFIIQNYKKKYDDKAGSKTGKDNQHCDRDFLKRRLSQFENNENCKTFRNRHRQYLSLFYKQGKILEEIFLRVWTIIAERFKVLIADETLTGPQKVTEFVLFLAEQVKENRNIAPIILQEYQFWNTSENTKLKEKIQASLVAISGVISTGIATGEFSPTLDPRLITAFLSGGVWFILEYWTDHFDTVSYTSVENQLRELAEKCLK